MHIVIIPPDDLTPPEGPPDRASIFPASPVAAWSYLARYIYDTSWRLVCARVCLYVCVVWYGEGVVVALPPPAISVRRKKGMTGTHAGVHIITDPSPAPRYTLETARPPPLVATPGAGGN